MDVAKIIDGLISSVPEAITLWHRIMPMIAPSADVSQADIDAVDALVPEAHAAVEFAHGAISSLISAHAVPVAAIPSGEPAPAPAA